MTLPSGRAYVIILKSGRMELRSVDHSGDAPPPAESLASPSAVLLPRHGRHCLSLSAGARGTIVAIPMTVLLDALTACRHLDLTEFVRLSISEMRAETAHFLASLVSQLDEMISANEARKSDSIRLAIALVLVEVHRHAMPPDQLLRQSAPRTIVNRFHALVQRHFREHWSVQDYAKDIGVSRDRLNTAVRRASGQSPLQIIHAATLEEAKRLLAGSGMQTTEIAFALGFSDASYFSRFFRRMTGHTPAKFRQDVNRPPPERQTSFAAWP
ncbi:helix-turn-helix domain-containing protein [Notoacmeibacter sp. MSK16QG-6]|uniref:helix-turn-helix domain-containing protein n=1 Tax=Notoacmeibacter sp. MSK16QG-6 TaxID=2957982 RepID=UPI0020A03421|nr:helix-turn-helix domain-containing protein [Notoacmeibacter sp. MSK16QG-6]MCP1199523.1 AraC family transcriptional regulator [Notoacmeibacter sp. MSK16QG-6]